MSMWNLLNGLWRRPGRRGGGPRSGAARRRPLALEGLEGRLCPAPYLLVVDTTNDGSIFRFDGTDGHFVDRFVPPRGDMGRPDLGIILSPDGQSFLVDGYATHNVVRFNLADGSPNPAPGQGGANFVPPGSGGLTGTEGLAFGADGNLYVASDSTNNVLLYDGTTGAFLGTFVAPGSGGLTVANDLHFGPDGHLYVDNFDAGGKVLRYDETTGDPLPAPGRSGANFIDPNGGGLRIPNGFAWGPDGNLYVANDDSFNGPGSVLRYDGTTGDFLDVFVPQAPGIGFIDGIIWGPDGNLYVTNNVGGVHNILSFDGATGAPLGAFGDTGSSGLTFAAGLLFYDDGRAPGGPRGGRIDPSLVSASVAVWRAVAAPEGARAIVESPPISGAAPQRPGPEGVAPQSPPGAPEGADLPLPQGPLTRPTRPLPSAGNGAAGSLKAPGLDLLWGHEVVRG